MKTQYYTASSLDGFIATEDHSLDWLFPLGDINHTGYPQFIAQVGALAMGAATYEWMLRHVVAAAADPATAWPYLQPCWVFSSRQHPRVPGADLRFVRGDVRPVHGEMVEASQGRNVWLVGGGDLVGQFHDAGLLDEIIVQLASVTLGAGRPLLPRRITTPALHLRNARRIGSGFAELCYEVRRAPRVHAISQADRRFRDALESLAVAPADFNHKAHVRLAYIYLVDGDVDTAAQRMRDALLAFLGHHGVPRSKYHETLTRSWILATRHFMDRASSVSAEDFVAKNPELLDSRIMLTHYSAEVLFSAQAREAFVAPDLDPIPQHPGPSGREHGD